MEILLGHYLTLKDQNSVRFRFQNFYVGESSDGYLFLPFGFSGVTVSRQGDNVEATLLIPNTGIARSWSEEAIRNQWIATVKVMILPSIDSPNAPKTTLHTYVGQVTAGGWDTTSASLALSSVLDAVGSDVPRRRLHQVLVGNLPFTGAIAF